jgi:succinoglycan biosynthesis protein ExoM
MIGTGRNRPQARVDLCVCTYRRPELENALLSIGALAVSASVTVRVIVADNDDVPSACDLVQGLRPRIPFDILYLHAPASNISIARNACLDNADGDFVAFVDDDETVSPEWLAELLATASATGAEAVLGPVLAVYSADAPRWMREGDFHSTLPVRVKGEILTGYTCNVLLRRSSPLVGSRRFNLALGRTGGEDTDYFARLHRDGGTIAFSPHALVLEPVPENRAGFSWLAKRRFRMGQTHGRLLGEGRGAAGLARSVGLAAAKVSYCLLASFAFAPLPIRRNRSVLRFVMHAGVIGGLLGVSEIRLYGEDAREARGNAG